MRVFWSEEENQIITNVLTTNDKDVDWEQLVLSLPGKSIEQIKKKIRNAKTQKHNKAEIVPLRSRWSPNENQIISEAFNRNNLDYEELQQLLPDRSLIQI